MGRLGPIPTMKSVFNGHKDMCVEKEILDLLVNHLLYLFLNLCKLNISFYHPPLFFFNMEFEENACFSFKHSNEEMNYTVSCCGHNSWSLC